MRGEEFKAGRVTVPKLQAMKREGRKIIGIVVWDYQMARIVDRVGVDLVSVGDTVGTNLWGDPNPLAVTMDQMVTVCRAVRRGVDRALVSCDFPFGPLQQGPGAAVQAAIRLVKEAGVDMVKLDGASDHLEAVSAVTRAGIPVFAQFGITPQTALRDGIPYRVTPSPDTQIPAELVEELIAAARNLEAAGAAMLNFTNAGPVVGAAVAAAVSIPVVGGMGGGPWLDGRMRLATAAIGYNAEQIDNPSNTYANVAQICYDAVAAYADDVRAGRQIKGGLRT
ncbi:3-methyl-2-oxobutanoate hydroxymethyltransferase [Mycolicibacterium aromaticivorans JS19b1 = JCM 16368]|uniref:3-methyl-2-oxobutanoate hydroxymethyltransferase n=1 Tax=Mycolicibacterium aromaticivorans JS19b1 = JCM 16368 TaxID=1440774 RepID=A0A064CAD8_9MYCO|nr:3-methyl-2-oxobutanoate hydroxymethyltransferase [Mycolicibacterium aromaticivorans]KDE97275.1 3-methyl-2-oxobutanoate hydroxymethyltransferase [Mycolicibacterium aromaticivorans JS19b1 = JCM 16368]